MSLRVIGSAAFPIPPNATSVFAALQSVIDLLASRPWVNEVSLAFDHDAVEGMIERANIEGVEQYLTARPAPFSHVPREQWSNNTRLALICENAARMVRAPLPDDVDKALVQEYFDEGGMFIVRLFLPCTVCVPIEVVVLLHNP